MDWDAQDLSAGYILDTQLSTFLYSGTLFVTEQCSALKKFEVKFVFIFSVTTVVAC